MDISNKYVQEKDCLSIQHENFISFMLLYLFMFYGLEIFWLFNRWTRFKHIKSFPQSNVTDEEPEQ